MKMTTLMSVSALLLLLVTAVAGADQGCLYRGRSFDDGAFFLASNRCTKLQCYNGQVRTIGTRCAYMGLCYTRGSKIRGGSNGCILYECQRYEQWRAVETDPYKCADAFNRCKKCEE